MNLFKLLLETHESNDLIDLFELAESKAKFLVKQQRAGLLKSVALDNSGVIKTMVLDKNNPTDQELEDVIMHLSKISEKHLQWLVNKYCQLQGDNKTILQFRLEDTQRVKDAISGFEENRKRLHKKDLLQYKTLDDLENALFGEDFEEEEDTYEHNAAEEELIKNKDIKVLLKKPGLRVYEPKTMKASQLFGRGTKWCTASNKDEHNMHDHYSKTGSLYIVIAKGKKYQFHFGSGQFMDARDRPIKDVSSILIANPDLYAIFKKDAVKNGELGMINPKDITDAIAVKAFEGIIKKEKKLNTMPWLYRNFASHTISKFPDLKQAMLDRIRSNHRELSYFTFGHVNENSADGLTDWLLDIFTADDYESLIDSIADLNNSSNAYVAALLYFKGTKYQSIWMDKYSSKVKEEILKFIRTASAYDAFGAESMLAIRQLVNFKINLIDEFTYDDIVKAAKASHNQLHQLLELGLKMNEDTMIKLIIDNHSIIDLLSSPVNAHNVDQKLLNKLTERARMHSKASAEKGWR